MYSLYVTIYISVKTHDELMMSIEKESYIGSNYLPSRDYGSREVLRRSAGT